MLDKLINRFKLKDLDNDLFAFLGKEALHQYHRTFFPFRGPSMIFIDNYPIRRGKHLVKISAPSRRYYYKTFKTKTDAKQFIKNFIKALQNSQN